MVRCLGFLAKFFGFLVVIVVSYVLVESVLLFADLVPGLAGWTATRGGQYVPVFRVVLLTAAALFVAAFFTLPALLSMFGHAGAWVKHVLSRSARTLSIALGAAFLFYTASMFAPAALPAVMFPQLDSAVLLISLVLFLIVLFARSALMAGILKVGELFPMVAPSFDTDLFGRRGVAAVEFTRITTRQVREKSDPARVREEAVRFQRFVQTLGILNGKVELRLAFRKGRGRVLLSARARKDRGELSRWLLSVAKTHFPEFRAVILERPVEDGGKSAHSIRVEGAPEMVENPLEPLARYFLENNYDGDYQILIGRSRFNWLSRALARRKQRQLARESGEQRTEQSLLSPSEKSTSVRDFLGEVELEQSIKWLQRYASSRALKTWVFVTGRAETPKEARSIAEGASHVIQGTLSSHMAISALKVHSIGKRIRELRASGKPSILLPLEVVPYFWMPQMAMGTEVAPSTEFELPPELKGEIELGTVLTQAGQTAHQARIPLDVLVKHLFLTGMTGSGKTTSCFNLLMQLYQLGIPFLIIEPVKSEYRTLLTAVQSLQVFTLGDEETAPFRLNIFEPPEGVKVQTHFENLEAAWNASFVMYAPLPYVVKQVLLETYRACGWDVSKNKRGRPISLDDFRFQAEKVSRGLGYEPNVTMDIEAALRARILSLTIGGKGALFNAIASIPVETILRRPTVIELKDIPNNEEKAFVASLILMNAAEHIETKGRSGQLRHLTFIEEAHRLLPNVSTMKGDPESADPRRRMVEQFANMLAEIRAYGEGLAIVEQIPTKIIPDAIKNTATKIVHRVPAADDREVLAGAMNLSEEQKQVFAALQPGEAIISLERHPLPIRVQVPNAIERLGLALGEIGDEEVKRHMTEFYLRNPLPRASQSKVNADLLSIVETPWFGDKFARAYQDWREKAAKEPLTNLLLQSARKHSNNEDEVLAYARRILALAAERYLQLEEERAEFPRAFMRSIERSMRNARGS